jgi:hypothetical protein
MMVKAKTVWLPRDLAGASGMEVVIIRLNK